MPRYDYRCKCEHIFEVEKPMSAPGPSRCPKCGSANPDRYFGGQVPSVAYANRPPWTYKECLKYKRAKVDDGPWVKIDPNKHGDLGAWNSPGELSERQDPKPKKGKKNG
jgi:putative FmdB family regulatory protein